MAFTPPFIRTFLPAVAWSVAADDFRFLAYQRNSPEIYASTDGVNWALDPARVQVRPNEFATYSGVRYGGGIYGGKSGTAIYRSTDCVTWIAATGAGATGGGSAGSNGATTDGLYYFNGQWILLSTAPQQIFASSDLNEWAQITLPLNVLLDSLDVGDTRVLTRVSGGTLLYTDNGSTWNSYPGVFTSSRGAAYTNLANGNGVWVATAVVSGETSVIRSTDNGQTWVESATLYPGAFGGRVVFFNGVFVSLPTTSTPAAYSVDGIDWITFVNPALTSNHFVLAKNTIGLITKDQSDTTDLLFVPFFADEPPPPVLVPFWTNFNKTRERLL